MHVYFERPNIADFLLVPVIFAILLFNIEGDWGNRSKPEHLGVVKLNRHMSTGSKSSQVYLYSTFHMAYIDTMCFEWRDVIKSII